MNAEQTVTALLRACERRDFDRVRALVTDDVEYENVPIGTVFGPDGVLGVLSGGITATSTAVEWVVLHQVGQGDLVMNERVDRFLHDGRWIEVRIAAVFRVRGGRVCLWRDYFDLESYRRQRQPDGPGPRVRSPLAGSGPGAAEAT